MELENVIKLINAVSESSLTSFSMATLSFRLALTEVTGQLLKKLPVLMI